MTQVAQMFYAVDDMTKDFTFSDNNRVRDYFSSLLSYSVPDAMRGLSNFYRFQHCGNNVFAVNEFIQKFHDFTFAIYGTDDAINDLDCIINQIVAIKNDVIYDVGKAIKNKNSEIYTQYCRIPTFEFPGKHLSSGESLIQLPNPFFARNITFYNYLINNPDKKFIVKKS
ncbi:MAG: hypothetical protein K6B70_01425 [Clostridia bacterium]|nr:hypothetical protein [Clostridia bacterium]